MNGLPPIAGEAITGDPRLGWNLCQAVFSAAETTPEAVALVENDVPISYGFLAERIRCFAAHASAWGLTPGQTVGLLMANCSHYVVAFFALLGLGVTVIPINSRLTAAEVSTILVDAEAVALVTAGEFTEVLEKLSVPQLKGLVVFDPLAGMACFYPWVDGEAWLLSGCQMPEVFPVAVAPTTLATLVYTSGTTGKPKGVMLSHQNIWADALANIAVIGLQAVDVLVTISPLFHVFGQTNVLVSAMAVGAQVVLVPKFSPRKVLSAIQRHRVTFMAAVPTMYQMMLGHLKDHPYTLSSLRVCHSGAAAMPVALIEEIEQRFGAPVQEGYGLSEATSIVCSNPLTGLRKPGTVGPPIPGVCVSVRDEDGAALAPDLLGELWVQGPIVMQGYYKRPEETALALMPGGWLKTKDMARIDADGYVSIVDRKDDLINVGGVKVYPREIEEVLHKHPAVAATAVVGEPSALYHQTIKAFVVLREGQTATPDALFRFCAESLAAFKIPKTFVFVEEIPKGATGKILRRALRSQEAPSGA